MMIEGDSLHSGESAYLLDCDVLRILFRKQQLCCLFDFLIGQLVLFFFFHPKLFTFYTTITF